MQSFNQLQLTRESLFTEFDRLLSLQDTLDEGRTKAQLLTLASDLGADVRKSWVKVKITREVSYRLKVLIHEVSQKIKAVNKAIEEFDFSVFRGTVYHSFREMAPRQRKSKAKGFRA